MRHSGSWQSVWDDRILEWISENGGSGTAAEIDKSGLVRVTRSHISRRLNILADHGLLKEVGNGAFIITDEGEAYLKEEYDAENGVYLNQDGPATTENGIESEQESNGA